MLLPCSGRTAGLHQLKGLVWWDRWGLSANWTMKWHGVRGRAPGSNSLHSIARFALPRVNTAPKPPKTNKTHFSGIVFTNVALPIYQTDASPSDNPPPREMCKNEDHLENQKTRCLPGRAHFQRPCSSRKPRGRQGQQTQKKPKTLLHLPGA